MAALSFPAGSPLLDSAKLGIFGGSLIAGTAGFLWLRHVAPQPAQDAPTVEDALLPE